MISKSAPPIKLPDGSEEYEFEKIQENESKTGKSCILYSRTAIQTTKIHDNAHNIPQTLVNCLEAYTHQDDGLREGEKLVRLFIDNHIGFENWNLIYRKHKLRSTASLFSDTLKMYC